MIKLARSKFERIVSEGVNAIPEKFLQKIKNVEVVVENLPSQAQKRKLILRRGRVLLGLYEGVPQASRGNSYTAVLPDKITIFKDAVESVASSKEEVKEIVKDTIWHEIAHHFGMDENMVRRAEIRRRRERSLT